MGLFDFVFHFGEKFTKDEIKILDMNFNSISAYTKKNYKFLSKEVQSDVWGHESVGINFHRVTYRHGDIDTDEWDPNWHLFINCDRYLIRGKREYSNFINEFDSPYEDKDYSRINIPKIKKFPTSILIVGYRGHGFAVEFKYNYENSIDRTLENSDLTNECIKKIESCTIKYLKGFK